MRHLPPLGLLVRFGLPGTAPLNNHRAQRHRCMHVEPCTAGMPGPRLRTAPFSEKAGPRTAAGHRTCSSETCAFVSGRPPSPRRPGISRSASSPTPQPSQGIVSGQPPSPRRPGMQTSVQLQTPARISSILSVQGHDRRQHLPAQLSRQERSRRQSVPRQSQASSPELSQHMRYWRSESTSSCTLTALESGNMSAVPVSSPPGPKVETVY